jgi:hypothetical protein
LLEEANLSVDGPFSAECPPNIITAIGSQGEPLIVNVLSGAPIDQEDSFYSLIQARVVI